MLSEVFKNKTVPLYKHKLYLLQVNGDSIAKVSIEGW